ncbi:MAG: glycine cleavage system protein R [Gammaproteobacteria bacterium]|nr:glycine cleavage system protein R [Gammaproteobacteria bacterium]NIM75076.1 glycine cleavage system protein R [Gammaproteobacteria bacterium]NIN40126.1 glycine cleavage system protein R [Gammaproteobacteria bacterium]NIO26613.1 glycine cleavage system protein R [Gammaproteobacteria bacterium]NIO67165.1 glycine cleavage system protein R [Gammaproteobacteria bacterium]
MDTHLVISAVGRDRPGLIDELSRAILDCGCNIGDSRMAVLGSELAIMMALSGHWNAIAKLENQLPKLEESLGIKIISKRSEPRTGTENLIPYGVEVVSIDHPGIVYEVTNFFSRRGINVEDLYTSSYSAPHTGAAMFALHMTVGIPSDTAIASVRGDFMDFCDDLNLDAMMAPVK